jgi:hypothetical protein
MKFACLIGLRPGEVIESVRLLCSPQNSGPIYYNPEQQCLEHFRYSQIFLRRTKKAYILFVTPDILEMVKEGCGNFLALTTYNHIRLECNKQGIGCNMRFCRKVFAMHLRHSEIATEINTNLYSSNPARSSTHFLHILSVALAKLVTCVFLIRLDIPELKI